MNSDQEQLKTLFNQRFQELMEQQAAAEALKVLSQSSKKTSIEPLVVKPEAALAARPPSPPVEVKLSSDIVSVLITQCSSNKSFTPLIRLINEVFSSPKLLCACFTPKNDAMEECSEEHTDKKCGMEGDVEVSTYESMKNTPSPFSISELDREIKLDISEVTTTYNLLLSSGHEGVVNSLMHALVNLSSDMSLNASRCEDPVALKQYLITLAHPRLLEPDYQTVLRSLFGAMDKLPPLARTSIVTWLRTSVPKAAYLHFLSVIRQHITLRMYQGAIEDARKAVKILALVFAAHSAFPDVPISEFVNDAICEDYIPSLEARKKEYRLWLNDLGTTSTSHATGVSVDMMVGGAMQSIISYSFVLTAGAKASVLELDAAVQMRQGQHQEYEDAVASGSQFMSPYLVLRVRREHVVMDTISHFVAFTDNDFKKPLKVVFDNEEGIDAGGVRKEFYQIMMKQLLDPSFGMFKYFESSRLLWFNSDSFESHTEFEMIGILLGVAIYNSVILDFRMPKFIYKKLKGLSCGLADLEELQPDLFHGLTSLLNFTGDVEGAFQFTFQITYETLGELKTVDLKENGGEITVTTENRQEYVDLYVDYLINKSVESQFEAFKRGFKKVCGGAALDMFTAQDLDLLICGNPVLDFEALKEGTRYEDGYDGSEPVVQWFWESLLSLDDEEQKLFLKFVSGSDRSPIDGLAKLGFIISRNGDDDTRLPSAHTCFNHLLLPQYSSKEVVLARLKYCIQESEGFGLM